MPDIAQTIQDKYNNYRGNLSYGAQPGYNGLTGFKTWECYMIVKFGNNGSFGYGDSSEYLLELPIYPETVTETLGARWNTQNIIGRSAPLSAYAGTDLKSVSFSLDLHRDLMTGSYSIDRETLNNIGGSQSENQLAGHQMQTPDGPFDTRTWYVNANKMLQISCYPQYTDNGLMPPITYFIFGQMILKGYVTSYSTTWKKPILNQFYGWNSVTISMECFPDTVISARNIIESSGAASTQNTFNTAFPSKSVENSNVMTRYSTTHRSNNRSGSSLGGTARDV